MCFKLHKSMVQKIKKLWLWFILKSMRRWNPGLLYFSLKAINPHKSALPTNPAAPAALDKWSVLYQAPKRYKDAFTLWWFLEGVTSAGLNQWFPWLSKDNWERVPKRGGISAGWIPAAPDCTCPFSRALGELYLPWCSLETPGCETQVWQLSARCVQRLLCQDWTLLVCSGTLCLLFLFLQENLLIYQLHMHLLISYTLY